MSGSLRDISETWFRRVWWEQDEDAISEMLAPEIKVTGLADQDMPAVTGVEEFRAFHRALLQLIDDVDVEIKHFMSEGNWVSALCLLKAKCRATGRKVEMRGHVLAEIKDEKIVDAHNNFDFIGLFEQLELMPQNAFSTCLAGSKVT